MLTHDRIERNQALLIVLIVLVVAVGGLVEIVPLYSQPSVTEPVAGLNPDETERVGTLIRQMRRAGTTLIRATRGPGSGPSASRARART